MKVKCNFKKTILVMSVCDIHKLNTYIYSYTLDPKSIISSVYFWSCCYLWSVVNLKKKLRNLLLKKSWNIWIFLFVKNVVMPNPKMKYYNIYFSKFIKQINIVWRTMLYLISKLISDKIYLINDWFQMECFNPQCYIDVVRIIILLLSINNNFYCGIYIRVYSCKVN